MPGFLSNPARLAALAVAAASAGCVVLPPDDFEVQGPDGRRILLRNDGTWRYARGPEDVSGSGKARAEGEAVLTLTGQTEDGPSCRFAFQMANNLPYEIHSVVLTFVAFRAGGVVYRQVSTNFNDLFPGNTLKRSALFESITCREIARLQVTGGDRCTMGDLDKFSAASGECLARVRVVPSPIVQFDK